MSDPLPPGYTLLETLGAGAFGVVHKARWQGTFDCAVKVLEGAAAHRPYLCQALEKLRALPPREGLLRIYTFDLTGSLDHVSMALLPPDAVTADEIAGRVTEEEAWMLLRQLAETLAWLHGHEIAHAGLSGGNVFVMGGAEDGDIVTLLSDTGQAWLGEGGMERLHDQAGYIPPERWREPGVVLHGGHAETWDVYAFGVLAFRLLTGRWPLADELFQKVLASKGTELSIDPAGFAQWLEDEPAPVWPTPPGSEEENARRRLVERCLCIDAKGRPADMGAVLRELKAISAAETPKEDGEEEEKEEDRAGPAAESRAAAGEGIAVKKEEASDSEDDDLEDEDGFEETGDAEPPAPRRKTAWWPAALGWAAAAAALAYAAQTRGLLRAAETEAAQATGETEALRRTIDSAAKNAAELTAAADGEKPRRIAALRDQAAAVAGKMLETRKADPDVRQAAVTSLAEYPPALKADDKNGASPLIAADAASAASLDAWKAAAGPAADALDAALKEADALPALAAEGLPARWLLARLCLSLGRKEQGQTVLEHLSRDLAAAAAAGTPDPDGSRRLLAARTAASRGRLLREARQSMDADPLLREASTLFEEWLSTHPDDRAAARDYAANSLEEGLALLDRRQTEDARNAFVRIAGLTGKPADPDFQPEDSLVLARAWLESARIDTAAGRIEPAIEQHMQAVRLLVDYEKSHAKSVPCRSLLAEGYTGLGRLLTKNGTPGDASVAFAEAVTLLSDLTRESGDTSAYKLQLALTYDDVARLIRASRPGPEGVKEAIVYQNGSVTTLRSLNEANALDNVYRRSLASSLELNGELLEASGDATTARARLEESLEITSALIEEDTLPENERLECRRLGARALSVLGSIHEKAGRKKEAVAVLSRAVAEWEASSKAATNADEPLVAAAREKLKKLQPGK